MKNEIVKYDEKAVAQLDQLASLAVSLPPAQTPFARAFQAAEIMQGIRTALSAPGIMNAVMTLAGSPIGFRTDKEYSSEQIKDALIEAIMHGLQPIGNQFNVISSRCYVTREGFDAKLKMMPDLWYQITPHVPKMGQGGAVQKMSIAWKYKGVAGTKDLEFAVRVNAGMGADAIIGKAERKSRAWLWRYLTGSEMPEGDVADPEDILTQGQDISDVPTAETKSATEKLRRTVGDEPTDAELDGMM